MIIKIFGEKVANSAMYVGNKYTHVTLVKMFSSKVVGLKTFEKNGYDAIQMITGVEVAERKINKPQLEVLKKAGLPMQKKQFEIRLPNKFLSSINVEVGQETIDFEVLKQFIGLKIDAQGVTQGKGFAGGMKRHGFKGLGASHGESVSHRSLGSTGNRQDPGKVFKNKKMAGHMGRDLVTIKNLKIVDITAEGLLVVEGSIPGSVGSHVFINDASNSRASRQHNIINGIDFKKAN